MSLINHLAKMSLSVGGAVLTGTAMHYVPLLTIYGDSTSRDALLILNNDQIVPLKDMAPPVKLSHAQRVQKIEALKKRIFGFCESDTARLKDSLDKLLSIQDASVMEVLDNLPDNLAIDYKKDEKNKYAGQYSSADSKIYMTDLGLSGSDIFLTATMAHEMFHAKQDARGFIHIHSMYRDTETTAAFNLIVEAEARSFERHVSMRLAVSEDSDIDKEQLFKLPRTNELIIYTVEYVKARDTLERQYPYMSQKTLKQEAELMARGNYIQHLLKGGDCSWTAWYLESSKQEIMTANAGVLSSLPTKSDARLEKYMWSYMEKTYGLTRDDIKGALNMIFQTPAGQEVLAFKSSESNWTNRIKNAKELYYMERKKQVPSLSETYNSNAAQPVQRVTAMKTGIWQNNTR